MTDLSDTVKATTPVCSSLQNRKSDGNATGKKEPRKKKKLA